MTTIPAVDADGHLRDHTQWTAHVATALAQLQGINLTTEMQHILILTRHFYREFDHVPTTRALIKYLNLHLAQPTNNQQLMQLFQTGLIARTIAKLAGLPKPPNCI